MPVADLARFQRIDTWIFDLDNTLYPPHADLWPKVDQKITQYIAHLIGVDGLSARAIQKYYYAQHGTTLNGLMIEHGIDPHAFLDFVHDIDRSNLDADARLGAAIARLPGRKLVFTNGSRGHAVATMKALGIDHLFEDVFDIVSAGFVPKPAREPYDRFLAAHGITPARAAMFEDIPRNLVIPQALGMATVLVVPGPRGSNKDEWDKRIDHAPEASGPDVDATTHDLPDFLDRLSLLLGKGALPGTAS
jgi:putative hydrolase of the HAD superfamily